MAFPSGFWWGAATASYQIEGAVRAGGRGESIWDRFSHTPGRIDNGDTGDVACDHYHRYAQDIELMKFLGINAYRFSVAWPRILPEGKGKVNRTGLDFYDRLTDGLLAANIRPFLTLYHWDLPQALQALGGWANRDSIGWFSDYVDVVSRRLGDRIGWFATHNEPEVIAFGGHLEGLHAPGIQDPAIAYRVAHHLLLSHAHVIPILRHNAPQAQLGIVLNQNYVMPADESHEEEAILMDALRNRWFMDPVLRGVYPQEAVEHLGTTLEEIDLAEVGQVKGTLDFFGLNYYTRRMIGQHPSQRLPVTAMGWEFYPDGLYQLLLRLKAYQAPPIYITENGAAYADPAPINGVVEDPQRVAYYDAHLDTLNRAIAAGVDVRGYFAWSLMDNFEWRYGYSKRFGLFYVDYQTQQRTPKRSAYFYRDFIEQTK